MTDILDLPGWAVIAKTKDAETDVLEAEYTVQPTACPKCGTIDQLYRHGTKPVTYLDSPIRGSPARLLAKVQRYRCRSCGETFLQPLGGIQSERRMTERCATYIQSLCLRDTFVRIAEDVGQPQPGGHGGSPRPGPAGDLAAPLQGQKSRPWRLHRHVAALSEHRPPVAARRAGGRGQVPHRPDGDRVDGSGARAVAEDAPEGGAARLAALEGGPADAGGQAEREAAVQPGHVAGQRARAGGGLPAQGVVLRPVQPAQGRGCSRVRRLRRDGSGQRQGRVAT